MFNVKRFPDIDLSLAVPRGARTTNWLPGSERRVPPVARSFIRALRRGRPAI